MGGKLLAIAIALISIFSLSAITSTTGQKTTIPADRTQLQRWFSNVIKPYKLRMSEIDPPLVAAEQHTKIIKVKKDGSGNFKTISEAIRSVPVGNKQRVIIWIGGGVYHEKIKIERTKPFITLYGSPNDIPQLSFNGNAATYGTVDSATLIVESDYFTAVNLVIANSCPRPNGKQAGSQAVALRISGDKAAFYNCKIIGYQDTLCDDRGRHFFKDCVIVGTVDFIFGSGTSLYLNTNLHVLGDNGFTVITAQAREGEDSTGYSFVHCKVDGVGGKNTYLGRAWKSRPRVVFAYSTFSNIINSAGWSLNFHPQYERTVFFGEHKCSGPGAGPAGRAKFIKQLSEVAVQQFISLNYVQATKWLLPPPRL